MHVFLKGNCRICSIITLLLFLVEGNIEKAGEISLSVSSTRRAGTVGVPSGVVGVPFTLALKNTGQKTKIHRIQKLNTTQKKQNTAKQNYPV